MSNVIDFTARRLAKQKPPKTQTVNSLYQAALDFLLGDWQKMAKTNRLNDYFKRSISSTVDLGCKVNYMSGLNDVATLEMNHQLFPIIYFPGTLKREQLGWIVSFKIGDTAVMTPELATEAYARCFAIMLFLKLKRDMTAAGFLTS